jgi:hypothetical protein
MQIYSEKILGNAVRKYKIVIESKVDDTIFVSRFYIGYSIDIDTRIVVTLTVNNFS